MTGLWLKSAAFSVAMVCFFGGSAVADSFTFTGTAARGGTIMDFFLSGPSFSIHSAAQDAGSVVFAICSVGTLCTVDSQFIQVTPSNLSQPGDFSGGTVGGITADTLGFGQGLTFFGFSFIAGTNPKNFGSGPVTFAGNLTGYVFPPGCEPINCFPGDAVFNLQLGGSGTGTASGFLEDGRVEITELDYTFHGTATGAGTSVVPEPSSLLLLSTGLTGIAALRRWHLLRRVKK